MTHLARWKPLIDKLNNLSFLFCEVFDFLKERIETEVGYLTAPKSLHCGQVQILKTDDVVFVSYVIRKFEVVVIALIGDFTMDTRQSWLALRRLLLPFFLRLTC